MITQIEMTEIIETKQNPVALEMWKLICDHSETSADFKSKVDLWLNGTRSTVYLRDTLCLPFKEQHKQICTDLKLDGYYHFLDAYAGLDSYCPSDNKPIEAYIPFNKFNTDIIEGYGTKKGQTTPDFQTYTDHKEYGKDYVQEFASKFAINNIIFFYSEYDIRDDSKEDKILVDILPSELNRMYGVTNKEILKFMQTEDSKENWPTTIFAWNNYQLETLFKAYCISQFGGDALSTFWKTSKLK